MDALMSSCLHCKQVCLINTNTKDHKDENISRPGEAVNWLAYIKRFLHGCGFHNTVCGLFFAFLSCQLCFKAHFGSQVLMAL